MRRACFDEMHHQNLTQAKPKGQSDMARLRTQHSLFESSLDVVLQPPIERVRLSGCGHLASQQHHHPTRLFDRKPRRDSHTSRDAFNRVGHPPIGAGDLCLNLHPYFCRDRASKVILVSEVIEKASFGYPSPGHKIVDRNRVDRAVDQQVEPGSNQRRARSLGTE